MLILVNIFPTTTDGDSKYIAEIVNKFVTSQCT